MSELTPEVIEAREYTLCDAMYDDAPGTPGKGLRWEQFLIPGWRDRADLLARARHYATSRWGEPKDVYVFPRNYVRDARRLYAEGRYATDGAS